MIVIMKLSAYRELLDEVQELRTSNKHAWDHCNRLQKRFAPHILYGDTAPKDPVAAAQQAFASIIKSETPR